MRRAEDVRLQATLLPRADSVRRARELIRSLYARARVAADPDTALLLVSELVSNAILHARSTIRLTATGGPDRLRVEVSDRSTRLPLAHFYASDATTGRGLRLVDRLSDAWGFDTLGTDGKTVWFELGSAPALRPTDEQPLGTGPTQPLVSSAPAGNSPEPGRTASTVRLLRLPLQLQARAAEHHDGLVREFMLLATRATQPRTTPMRLVQLIDQLGNRFAGSSRLGEDQLRRARLAGLVEIDLVVDATPETAREAVRLVELMTEADAFCRAGDLLTLAAPDDVVDYRDWYLDELVGQLSGSSPMPWPGPW